MVLKKLQRTIDSKLMADKRMSRMTVFCEFHKHKSNLFSVLPVWMKGFLF